jgi:hypothetical protein
MWLFLSFHRRLMFILWPYSMGNAIAGECCGDAFHSWMEVLGWQMGSFPGKFGSSLV